MRRAGALMRGWLAPISLYCLVLIAIAMIGGGWLALGRVDPLLAVPGAGWAAVVAVWASRRQQNALTLGVSAGAGAILLGAVLLIDAMDGLRGGEWIIVAIALIASAQIMGAVAHGGTWLAGPRRWAQRLMAFVCLPLIAIGWTMLASPLIARAYAVEVPADHRVRLAWLTSLPLAEQRYFDLQWGVPTTGAQERPVPHLLNAATRATRLFSVDAAALADADVLLLAHPPALDPAQLVAIDDWVRGGGRAVVLADGLSSRSSAFPLGDPRNPPVTSLLGPLLAHWGLDLSAPEGLAESRVVVRDSSERLELLSAGRFRRVHSGCSLRAAGLIGDCRVGRGRAVLIADADMLDPATWAGRHGAASSVDARSGNMLWLLDKLSDVSGNPLPFSLARPSWSRSRQALLAPVYPEQL